MNYRILIIDADQTVIDDIQENLESIGYSACWAKSNEDAFQRLDSEKIDLVISSIQGGEIDGFKVIEHVKQKEHLLTTQVILITDVLNKDELLKGKHLGIEGYFQKPINISDVAEKIKHLLCNEGLIKKLKKVYANLQHESKNLKSHHDSVLHRLRLERSKRHDQMVSRQREMWKISINIKGKKYTSSAIAAEESKRFEKIQECVEQDRDFIRTIDSKIQSTFQEFQENRQKNSEKINLVQKHLNSLTQ